jgi:hypothetical protein
MWAQALALNGRFLSGAVISGRIWTPPDCDVGGERRLEDR